MKSYGLRFLDWYAVARWSVLTTQRRGLNRMWDVVGRAAGYCMATTWRQDAAAYGLGMRQWRCWVLRSQHAGPHRTGSYVWRDGAAPVYDPIPGGHHAPVPGQAPRWIRSRHYNVGTRRRDRLAVRHAFGVLQARSQRRLSEAAAEVAGVALEPWQADAFDRLADEVLSRPAASDAGISVDRLTTGELGHVPFTRPPEDEADRIAAQMRALQDRVNQAKTRTIVYGGAGWGDAVVSSVRLHDGPTWQWVRDGRGWTTIPRHPRHAFIPGDKGTPLEIYCQAPAEPGSGPVPGHTPPLCGWPESQHPTPDQARRNTADDVDDAVREIYGEDPKEQS